jgi:hypothetical protein
MHPLCAHQTRERPLLVGIFRILEVETFNESVREMIADGFARMQKRKKRNHRTLPLAA